MALMTDRSFRAPISAAIHVPAPTTTVPNPEEVCEGVPPPELSRISEDSRQDKQLPNAICQQVRCCEEFVQCNSNSKFYILQRATAVIFCNEYLKIPGHHGLHHGEPDNLVFSSTENKIAHQRESLVSKHCRH